MRPPGPDAASKDVEAFLRAYFQDQEQGRVHDRDHYLELFPQSRDAVARAWEEVAVADAQETERRIGPYRLLRLLGSGGQGEVHLARDERLDREVAVKSLAWLQQSSGQALARFRREAEVASRLAHPSVCPVHELDWHQGRSYIVMPYVEGETFASVLRRTRTAAEDATPAPDATEKSTLLDIDSVCALIEKVARALHVAHEAGIVHRDVKPGNLMIKGDGEPVILDFGVAAVLEDEEVDLTLTGQLVGTIPYMAPEQVSTGSGPVDRRTDVFALGICLFEGLTLTHPFSRGTLERTRAAILEEDPPSLRTLRPDLPRDLCAVLETALQKAPHHRYATAADFADDLGRLLRREPVQVRHAGPLLRLRRWSRRKPALAAAVIGLFMTLAAGLTISILLLRGTTEALAREETALKDLEAEQRDRQLTLDGLLVADLVSRVDELWPATPERVADPDGIDAWLAEAERLVETLPRYEAQLAEVRDRALPPAATPSGRAQQHRRRLAEAINSMERLHEAPPFSSERMRARSRAIASRFLPGLRAQLAERSTWEFQDPEDGARHITLQLLVREVPKLEPLIARVGVRREFAVNVHERTLERHRDHWARALAEIAADPRYEGTAMEPQLGLVPLGRDRASGLQEFAHLATGLPPARDAETGRLLVGEKTGVVFVLLPGGFARLGGC